MKIKIKSRAESLVKEVRDKEDGKLVGLIGKRGQLRKEGILIPWSEKYDDFDFYYVYSFKNRYFPFRKLKDAEMFCIESPIYLTI